MHPNQLRHVVRDDGEPSVRHLALANEGLPGIPLGTTLCEHRMALTKATTSHQDLDLCYGCRSKARDLIVNIVNLLW